MRLSLSQKLVLAFLGLTLLILIATLGLARWSFQQGFLDYVNAIEQTRLETLRDDLVDEYVASGNSWESLTHSRFGDLLRSTDDRPGAAASDNPPPPDRRPGPKGPPPGERLPPERGPPTALYDANNRQIVGDRLTDSSLELIRVPIVLDGTPIGELRTETHRRLSSLQDTAFSKQQLTTSWIIGVLAMGLALTLSLGLARGLLAPIRRMIGNVAQLSSGDYSARLQERRNDELGELMSDLDRLGATLEENRSSQRRWLADISHELRTPLTVLTGEIEALKDGVRTFDRQQLDSLEQELGRLRYLIDDLYELSVSDIGGLRYTFSAVDLKACLDSVVEATRERASDRGIELMTNDIEHVFVNADVNRMDQLFQNLLENSLAYTDGPGQVAVTLSRTDDLAIVEIDDTPPGASESECERLFDPLYRREMSRNRRTGGAGLGLAICRNIVSAHQGEITASPSTLGGLHIRIELPIANERKT